MGLITDLLNKAAKEAKDFLKDCGVLESGDTYVPPTENNAQTPPEPKEPQRPIIPECNNGECGVYEYRLYHSCEKSAQCPKMLKKKYYNAMRTVSDKKIFDFIIRYAKDEKTYDYKDKERIPGEYSDAVFPNLSEIKRFIVNVVLPFESMDPNESLFIKFLLEMNDKCVAKESYGPNLNRLYEAYRQTRVPISAEDKAKTERVDRLLTYPSVLLRDPTLFERDAEDFKYSYDCIDAFCSPDFLTEKFKDISLVTVDMLFDKNGRLKPAGIGGAEIGETGDTIWNTVEKLCRNSNENYIGEEK